MTLEIRLTQAIAAPRDSVWRACSSTRGMMGWQADSVRGEVTPGAKLTLGWPALGVSLDLEVVELVPERRIVLAKGATVVELTLFDGGVELTQSEVGEGDEREGVLSSWNLSLGLLMHYCEAHSGTSRSVRWLMQPARTSTETAHVFFSDRHALSTWLGMGEGIGPAGSRFSFELDAGERASGRVLANTPGRDLAVSWEEDGGSALVLRTLPRPFEPEVRLVVLSYSRWGGTPAAQSRLDRLEAAHHRLIRALDSERQA